MVDQEDAENTALMRVLKEHVAEWEQANGKSRGGLRAVGLRLGYEKESAQANVSAAIKRGRVSAEMALRIYDRLLKVPRERFLASLRGKPEPMTEPTRQERVFLIAARLNRSAADALRVSGSVAAYKGEISDEEIVSLFEKERDKNRSRSGKSLDQSDQSTRKFRI